MCASAQLLTLNRARLYRIILNKGLTAGPCDFHSREVANFPAAGHPDRPGRCKAHRGETAGKAKRLPCERFHSPQIRLSACRKLLDRQDKRSQRSENRSKLFVRLKKKLGEGADTQKTIKGIKNTFFIHLTEAVRPGLTGQSDKHQHMLL